MDSAPPGLQHDEIFKAEEGWRLVEHGQFRVFYPTNQGHEGAYVWLLGLSYSLFGKSLLMIKFPALIYGLLTVALVYRLAGEAYDDRVAVAAGGMTAVSFWSVYISRVGLRAVMLPVFVGLFGWLLYRVCFREFSRPAQKWLVAAAAGGVLGGSIYTYTASPVLFLAYGAFVVFFGLVRWKDLKRVLPQIILISVLGLALTLPMVNARLNNTLGMERASVISGPWSEFRAGNPEPLLEGARKLAGMFAFTGDPEWRYNVADRPLFLLPIGLLVYLGGGVALVGSKRQPLNFLIVMLVVLGMIPSLLTTTPPSFLRSVAMLPAVMILIGLALAQIGDWLERIQAPRWAWGLIVVVLGVTAVADFHAYFVVWPQNTEVQSIYRDDLEQLAAYVQTTGEPLVAVSTPNTELDPLIVDYIPHPNPEQSHLAFFDGATTIVLSEEQALIAVSPLSPISQAHAYWLQPETGTEYAGQLMRQDNEVAYDLYRLNATAPKVSERLTATSEWPVFLGPEGPLPSTRLSEWAMYTPLPVNFGDVVELVGIEIPYLTIPEISGGVNLQLYLRPLVTRQEMPLNIFVHLMTPDQTIVAQRDLLGSPTRYWRADMVIEQDTFVPFWDAVAPGQYILTAGVYNWLDGRRLPVVTTDTDSPVNRVFLGVITVTPSDES